MTPPPEPVVLLVEDDEADIELTQRALQLGGFEGAVKLLVARDGQEAYERLKAGERFDLVVTDIKMPRMTGLELLAKLRAEPALSATRVVVLTSSAEERDLEKATALGALEFLQKPMSFDGWPPILAKLRARLAEPLL